eukprot:m.42158 g.42158  ORF g.42158 m.42158 type:complete len:775 (-) comp6234_c0_seq1:102-2426(-)
MSSRLSASAAPSLIMVSYTVTQLCILTPYTLYSIEGRHSRIVAGVGPDNTHTHARTHTTGMAPNHGDDDVPMRTDSYHAATLVSQTVRLSASGETETESRTSEAHVLPTDVGAGPSRSDSNGSDPLDADGFDPMHAAKMFERRQTHRSSMGLATAFGEMNSRPRISLSWEDVCLDVAHPKTKEVKPILTDITGCAPTGEVLAIIGSSGAGKTTLLNLLGGWLIDTGHTTVTGEILANGVRRDLNEFSSYTATVLQSDLFFPELTVKETISFSATLRLPNDMPQQQKDDRVNSIITELGLRDVQDTYVGNDLVRGVSGGERKRVNIGTELVSDPSVIFLDEPTSGLDSFQAQNVMVALKVLARHGRTIITTIHQPRSDIYQMFDKLCVLSKGKLMYFGEAGTTAMKYFAEQGYPCPPNYNPADFIIDLISFDARSPELENKSSDRILELEGKMKKKLNKTQEHKIGHDVDALGKKGTNDNVRLYAASLMTQFKTLLPRSMNVVLREKMGNIQLVAMQIIPALMAGMIWFDEGSDLFGGEKVQAISGVLFFSIIHNMFNPVFPVAATFPIERDVVLKERNSKTYQIGPYFVSKAVAELPRAAFVVFLYHIISYFMIGLRADVSAFFISYAFLLLICGAAEGIALCISAAAQGPQDAAAAVPGPLVISILFGGFFIPSGQIPIWIRWLRYLAMTKYGFEGLMQAQFENRELCDVATRNCTCPETEFCPVTGEAVLEYYDVNELTIASNAVILVAYCFLTRLLAYVLLVRNNPKRVNV